MSKRIVIHGASSFLGKHFIKNLLDTHNQVIAITRKTSKLPHFKSSKKLTILKYQTSLKELVKASLKNFTGAVFYEFAWQGVFGSERNKVTQYTVNVPLMISSVEFADYIKAKHWIGIGSQAEYGNLNKKISETDQCQPTTLYGKAKLISSQITHDLCSKFKLDYTWLRLFAPYGPDDNHQWLIPCLIKRMLKNQPVKITKGEQRWDFLYIDDIVKALLKLLDSNGLGITNLGSGKTVLIKELVYKIKKLTNSSSKIKLGALPYRSDQVMYLKADIRKIAKELKWQPETNLETGLTKMIEYYKKRR